MRRYASLLLLLPLVAALSGSRAASRRPSNPRAAGARTADAPAAVQEAPAPYRAQLHAEIAAGFYERGQMDVALQELAPGGEARPEEREDLQRLRPRLRDARRGREGAAEFPAGAIELAPNDSEIRQNWGWYLCTHGRRASRFAEFEQAVRNPLYRTPDIALTNAGKCSIEIGDTRARTRRSSSARCRSTRPTRRPRTACRCSLYREGAARRGAQR